MRPRLRLFLLLLRLQLRLRPLVLIQAKLLASVIEDVIESALGIVLCNLLRPITDWPLGCFFLIL